MYTTQCEATEINYTFGVGECYVVFVFGFESNLCINYFFSSDFLRVTHQMFSVFPSKYVLAQPRGIQHNFRLILFKFGSL